MPRTTCPQLLQVEWNALTVAGSLPKTPRFIMNVTDPEIHVDHEDHNGLNCQRSNLRKCVRGENDGNRRKTRGSSQYRGVSWSKGKGRWRACITIEKTVHLGYFVNEREAALVYDTAARSRFGVFANCNFPLQE